MNISKKFKVSLIIHEVGRHGQKYQKIKFSIVIVSRKI